MVNSVCVPLYLALVMSVVSVAARSRYIVIPLDDIAVVGGGRVARHAWPGDEPRDQLPEQDGRVERQAHDHHEHVDYGAHTGHHGAFGWYADFPVKTDH